MIRLENRYTFTLPEVMPGIVKDLLERFRAMWYECDLSLPNLGRTFSLREKREREDLFHRYLSTLDAQSRRMELGEDERRAARERILAETTHFACAALDFDERQVAAIRSYGFLESAAEFTRQARAYDPGLSDGDIFQASRNVWSMNLMQVLLGFPVRMTPSVFAYSLLYPYSDNYLDDPAVPATTKISFNERFRHRLEGEQIVPANTHEQAISSLLAIIESEYDRTRFPEVYESLLAIHQAQGKSLRLLNREASPFEIDVLGVCLEKGGASVLADGYLVNGQLTPSQREFMFYYGTFTQLIDDLEDVEADLNKGIMTAFSLTARHDPLDAITNRTFHFWDRVAGALEAYASPQVDPLIEIIRDYVPVMLVAEAGSAGKYYSRAYLRELEAHCPFRFSFLIQERRRLARRGVSPLALIEAIA